MKYKLHTNHKKLLADTYTPVGIYLKLRDKFPNSILLESSDYHASDNSFSFICCQPIATIKVENGTITETYPDQKVVKTLITRLVSIPEALRSFTEKFEVKQSEFKFITNGLFGYTAYDAVKYFEDIAINARKKEEKRI